MRGTARKYRELDTIEVPEEVPEVGIKSGAVGSIVDIAPSGILAVEVVDESGVTVEILDLDPDPTPHVIGRWHVGQGAPPAGRGPGRERGPAFRRALQREEGARDGR